MSSEGTTQREIWGELGLSCTLYRVNTGRGVISGLGPNGVTKLSDGAALVKAARPIALGYADPKGDPVKGTADLNGWTTLTITPEMVGKKIAVYTSVETKRTKGGRVSPDQLAWQQKITRAGGIGIIANSPNSAREAFQNWIDTLAR